MGEKRRYGQWAGNPQGYPEEESRCVQEVYPNPGAGGGFVPRQCARKRGHGRGGLYCKQHAKKLLREYKRGQNYAV